MCSITKKNITAQLYQTTIVSRDLGSRGRSKVAGIGLVKIYDKLVVCANPKKFENTIGNFVADEVTINFNVFSLLVKRRNRGKVNDCLIIAK